MLNRRSGMLPDSRASEAHFRGLASRRVELHRGSSDREILGGCCRRPEQNVLLDLRMPGIDGLEVIAQIQSLRLPSKVIILTTFEAEHDVQAALKAGARGYLLKDIPRPLLLETIRQVHRGETCISPSIGQKLAENISHPKLSVREMEILKLVADGQSNKEIGNELGITEETVKTHVKSVLNKLRVPGRTAAIKEAIHRGLVHFG